MKNTWALVMACLLIAACATTQNSGIADSANVQKRTQLINATCFEVVTEKATQDSLSYDKPLNWDLLGFASRNDKYIPLGTAFAISATELVTAAHVLDLTSNSLFFTTRFIREKAREGGKTVEHVYEVDDIRAFDNARDYVIFTVKGRTFQTWLKTDTSFDLNKKIYTAGDAYGEGIVVREGVLLDTVPEAESGAWNNLKSSIATNPGNSGGPLLNEQLAVIGIVQSRKDDFCYSLPMSEVASGRAVLHSKANFGFTVFNKHLPAVLDETWPLPMKYRDLVAAFFEKYMAFYNKGMDALLSNNAQDMFPRGASSEEALYESVQKSFPQIFLQDSTTGSWFETDPELSSSDIGNNGSVSTAEIYKDAGIWLIRLDAPSDIDVRRLWDDPKLTMDTLLRGINLTRKVTDSDQGSRIVSYGAPLQSLSFADGWGRTWQLNAYGLEYSDNVVITCATPTPRGLSMLYVVDGSWQKDSWLYDLKKIADFVNVSYSGTLGQWDAFLGQPDFRFAAMKDVSVSWKEHGSVIVDSHAFTSTIADGLVGITRDSTLFLYCDVFLRKGAPVSDIRELLLASGNSDGSYYSFYRWSRPTGSLPKAMKDDWQKYILDRGHPYEAAVYTDSGQTNIGSLHPAFLSGGKPAIKGDFAYTLFVSKDGPATDQQMAQYMQDFAGGVKIKE
jgi:serine protease Do